VDAHGLPLRAVVTKATAADCMCADELIKGFEAQHLIADKGYDSDTVIQQAQDQGMQVKHHRAKTVKNSANMTNISIGYAIW